MTFKESFDTFEIGLEEETKVNERKNANIFLSISRIICFGYSKEPSRWDGSFEYQQHMFWL